MPIYLDNNATTRLFPGLDQELIPVLKEFGNPSSVHHQGRGPKSVLRSARKAFAEMIHCDPLEVVFTSGGTEANNLAIKGVYFASKDRNEYLVSAVEHPSVKKAFQFLEEQGAQVRVIPVSRDGQIDWEVYKRSLSERTALVSVMYANNETGCVFPIAKLAEEAHRVGALFHADCVQALGKTVVQVQSWGVDLASFSGHKFYGLKGSGALYVKKGTPLESLHHGGGQERGRRGGTENTLAICSLGVMAKHFDQVQENSLRVAALRDRMEQAVLSQIPEVWVTGAGQKRICNTSSFVIAGVDGEILLMNLDMKGIAVSTGAACSSGSTEPSGTLLAMGLSREEAQSSIRVSLSWFTTEAEVNTFVQTLVEEVHRLRSFRRQDVHAV